MKLKDKNHSGKPEDKSAHSQPVAELDSLQLEQLGEILDGLLVQAEAGQVPAVDAACEQHPELASAIRHYVRSMQMLHNAAHAKPLNQSTGSSNSLRINLLAPPERQLGDYRLVREIGRGGMGIVYEAQQQSLARRVALKILPFAAVLDSRQIARFQNEAQAAASLHHPHIVPVYAVGHERGTYYYSMQYIDGQTLEFAIDQVRQGRDGSLLGMRSDDPARVQLRNASTLVAGGSPVDRPFVSPDDLQQVSQTLSPRLSPKLSAKSFSAKSHSHRISGQPATNEPTADQPTPEPVSAGSTLRMAADASTVQSVRNRDYVRRVAEIGVQAAQALHYAHEHGIVHRDVKPSNLMIDASGNLWVTDFGLAQCATSSSLTRSGDVIGTLRYMSPEQAAGRSHMIDHRTDVYSLGATLYELLTLRAVVDSSDRMAMVKQIEQGCPVGLRRFNSAIPIDLENIVLKAISKSREERYSSADELAVDLTRFLAGQTPLARRPTLLDHSARWIRRHAKGVAIAGFVSLMMLVGAVAAAVMLQAKNREIETAKRQAENHLLRANEAIYQFGHSLMHRLELLPGSEEVRIDTARDCLAYFRAFASYAHSRNLMQADVARALMICGDLELQLGQAPAAIDHYRQSQEQWSRVDAPDKFTNQLLCQNNLANALVQLGQLDEAKQTLQVALKQLGNQAGQLDDVLSAQTLSTEALLHLNLGHVLGELHESRAAEIQVAKALTRLDSWPGDSSVTMKSAHADRLHQQLTGLTAAALVQSGQATQDAATARRLIERAVAIHQQRMQEMAGDPSVVHDLSLARQTLGSLAMDQGDIEDARRLFHKSVVELRRLHEQRSAVVRFGVDLASALNNLGQAELEAKAYASAEQNFRESKSLLERLHQTSEDYWIDSSLGGVCNNLAIVKEHQGQLSEAEQLLNEAIAYQELALSKSPDSARCRDFLAEHRAQLSRLVNLQKP